MGDELLPLNWKKVALKDTTEIIMGQSPPSETYNIEGKGYPFLQGKADFSERYPKPTKWCTKPLKVAEGGSILISVRAPVGDVNLADQNYIIGRGLCSIRFNKNYDNEFLFYCLMYNKKRIESQGSGTTFQSINKATLDNFTILFPPLPEQRAIARALRAVQAAREARLREITLERERKAALMEHLFTHGTRGEPTKMTEIGEMPESWEVVKFGKVIISSAFGPRFSSNYYDPDGSVATLRTTDLDNEGNINYSTMPLAKLELDGFKQHLLKSNDFLITRSGTCGIAAIFEAFEKPVLPGAFIIRFRLSNEINPLFLKYYVNSQQGRNRILQLAGGAVQKNLSGTSLRTFQIPLPLLVDQDAIVRSLIACDSKIAALDHEAHLHDKLFRAMLEELMTGRLRVGALATPSS